MPIPVKRLLTFSTPHLGSQWAERANWLGQGLKAAASAVVGAIGGPIAGTVASVLLPTTGDQMRDLAIGSQFINRLGMDWATVRADEIVEVEHVVAGDDGVVGLWSATSGFRRAGFRVLGKEGHISVVKPDTTDHPAYQIAKNFLCSDRALRRALPDRDWRQPLLQIKTAKDTHVNRFVYSVKKTDFVGRDDEITKLNEFLDASLGAFRWIIIHGAGGAGKSRLALEIIQTLQEGGGNWYAGFLAASADTPDWSRWQPVLPI